MSRLLPPARALRMATTVVGVVVALAALGAWWGGSGLAVAVAIGALGALPLSVKEAPTAHRVAFAGVLAGAAAAAAAVSGPVALGVVVAGSALAVVPFTVRYGPVGGAVPIVAVVIGAELPQVTWVQATVGVALASAGLTVILAALGAPRLPALPVAPRIAWTHAVLLAALSGLTTWVVLDEGWGHGVWAVFALTLVLLPDPESSRREAPVRVCGTVAGAIVGAVIAAALPAAVCLALAAVGMVLGLSHALVRQRRAFVAYSTAVVVLAASAAQESEWSVAGWRILFTVAGVGVALAGVVLMERALAQGERAE